MTAARPGRSAFWPDPAPDAPTPATDRELVRAEIEVLRAILGGGDVTAAEAALTEHRARHPSPTRLDEIESGFGLTRFERSLLLLAAAPALVGETAGELRERTGVDRVSFAAALAMLPGAHWDAITPQSPLRYWGLIELDDPADPIGGALRPAESVLHHIVGADAPDDRLTMLSQPVDAPMLVPEVFREVAEAVIAEWESPHPVALSGPQPANLTLTAAVACHLAGLVPRLVSAADLPRAGDELSVLLRRMTRQTVLSRWGWLVEASSADAEVLDALARAAPSSDAPLIILLSGSESVARWRSSVRTVPRLSIGDRARVWEAALTAAGVGADAVEARRGELETIAGTYDLAVADIQAVADDVGAGAELRTASALRRRIDAGGLGRTVTPRAGWDDLVLPDSAIQQLRALAASVRHRARVLDEWGFAARSRGLGTTALFAGPSGTGKTLAAEVIAGDLELDLLVVDLSQAVSKYIGETEKNLARLFDAAEDGGSVLLFDEADALFGKRTEVKDSHDRYANIEVDYLLQRLESFTGLAILTTNARSTLDRAFTRRLSTIVSFPYPDAASRRSIWRRSLPAAMPRDDLDLERLASVDLSGGEIAAAALQGAYLAAAAGEPVGMAHLRTASQWELGKSGRTTPRSGAAPRR